MSLTRRKFLRQSAATLAGSYLGSVGFTAASYARIKGANDRVRIGVIGYSDRFKNSLLPPFLQFYSSMNFEMVALSDIWKKRREEGAGFLEKQFSHPIAAFRNNEELYDSKLVDAVFISTADFQHALHTIEAVNAGLDVYCEKPFAETMADNRAALKAVKSSASVVTVGSQRRSGMNYRSAADFIQSGKFGPITSVELTWHVNQPGRWRRPALVAQCKEEDLDWKRFLMNRPFEKFDPRKYLEYRLYWPYSSGLPGQWMSHQIDTVHWFSGLNHPRSVVANGGVYVWKDGRRNWDTMTAVFDYGPSSDITSGFQVVFSSRMHNGDERPGEIYYSNGGELNLMTNQVSPKGGLQANFAEAMQMSPNLLPELSLGDAGMRAAAGSNTGGDLLTTAHVKNWMDCIRSRQMTNAPFEAGYNHSIATIMTNAAARTGERVTFDEKNQEVLAGGKIFTF
jgi:predicted dehydrogenase